MTEQQSYIKCVYANYYTITSFFSNEGKSKFVLNKLSCLADFYEHDTPNDCVKNIGTEIFANEPHYHISLYNANLNSESCYKYASFLHDLQKHANSFNSGSLTHSELITALTTAVTEGQEVRNTAVTEGQEVGSGRYIPSSGITAYVKNVIIPDLIGLAVEAKDLVQVHEEL